MLVAQNQIWPAMFFHFSTMFNVCVISESFLDKVSNNCPTEILKTVHISDIFQNIKTCGGTNFNCRLVENVDTEMIH